MSKDIEEVYKSFQECKEESISKVPADLTMRAPAESESATSEK